MAKLSEKKYTLVAHNGLAGYSMLSSISTEAQLSKVQNEGGIIFDTYKQADDAEYSANYAQTDGAIKEKSGHFSKIKHDGERIFIPTQEFKSYLESQNS
ncbi:hypothetical protein [Vibrio owensii]|uniref:hypothetical protein n=1 Tax=Vibrio harveyi group TaxID=717610 RepID=UPI003CC5996D